MPTRVLITRYEDDLRLFPDMWHRVGLIVGLAVVVTFGAFASDHWLSIGNAALISIVGAVAMMILTGFAGQICKAKRFDLTARQDRQSHHHNARKSHSLGSDSASRT